MARSENCKQCVYAGLLRGVSHSDWRNNITCDYYMLEGRSDDKGPDPDNCLLFLERSKQTFKEKRKFGF